MGKNARLKKQSRVDQEYQAKLAIESRKREAQAPIVKLIRRLIIAVVATIIILYIGQLIDQKIVHAIDQTEINQ